MRATMDRRVNSSIWDSCIVIMAVAGLGEYTEEVVS
ncbi:hypothetical protein MNBD_BACTEROID01-844 [hydrothermal vent metagenome]|uniref:Uncharacterized protein n=1 Tax=hydrothermal vent metagenome TaxID=652676 RepID=A0A3B0TQ52_9ZZZZ